MYARIKLLLYVRANSANEGALSKIALRLSRMLRKGDFEIQPRHGADLPGSVFSQDFISCDVVPRSELGKFKGDCLSLSGGKPLPVKVPCKDNIA